MHSDGKNTSNDPKTIMELDGGLYGQFQFSTNDCIGTGSFGKTFKGRNLYTFEEVAIKTEPIKSMQLFKENQSYKLLGAFHRFHNIPGLPEVYYLGTIGLKYTAMAMELLGPSLNEIFLSCGKKFTMKTVLMIAVQVLSRLEYIHSCKLIHRDIKPENLLVGRPKQFLPHRDSTENTLYLIDFGIAKLYFDPKTEMHVPFNRQAGVFGTLLFMSANTHLNIEQSRRDDLEALGYMLLYFVNGTLPWTKFMDDELGVFKCGQMKNSISLKSLCDGLPEEFFKYFDYVKHLAYSETPDYEMLKMLFNSTYENYKFPKDNLYDWSTME